MGTKIKIDGFIVVGIEARTSNLIESGPQGIIPSIWGKLLQDQLLEKIPNKIDGSIIAAYTDYESNKDGDYTFFLGTKVSSAEQLPAGMIKRIVPSNTYQIMTTQKGPSWKVVLELWQEIWKFHEENRNYLFDYELYDQRSGDPNNAEVDIYVGIKK